MYASLLVGLALIAGEPVKKDDAKATIVGSWIGESAIRGGKETPVPEGGVTLTFTEDGKASFKEGNKKGRDDATYKTDAKKDPAQIDILPPKDEPSLVGIYKIDGDTLTLCFSGGKDAVRPTKFESAEGSRTMLMVFNRKK